MTDPPSKTVLITGAAGFIGRACVKEFQRRGWRVAAVVHEQVPDGLLAEARAGAIALVRASLERPQETERAMSQAEEALGMPISSLVHCAGRASDIGRDRCFRAANYDSVLNILATMDRFAIGRLIYLSTTDVHGIFDFGSAGEETPFSNNLANPYPKYKIRAEEEIRASLAPERYVILRPAAVWGPGDTTILPRLLQFLKGTPCLLHFGRWKGKNRWPLCYIRTVATVAALASERDEALGKAIFLLDRGTTTIEEFYRTILGIYFPQRRGIRSMTLPFWCGWIAGSISTGLSNLMGKDHPLFDPSLYGLYSVSRNLDFSDRRMMDLFRAAGEEPVSRKSALDELRAWASGSNPG
jgi:nucleoside-diphosphate-sugar epimerase